jgi:hypothetical protein
MCPNEALITPAQAAEIISYMIERFKDPDKERRWYPLMREVQTGATANTEPTMINYENGDSYQVLPGSAIYTANWHSTVCFNKAVNKFNRYEGGLYVINMEHKLFGLMNRDGTLSPYGDVSISVSGGFFQGTGSSATDKVMQITFGDLIENENGSGFIDLGKKTGLKTVLVGISDLIPQVVGATGGAASIRLKTECDGVYVTGRYQTQFADADMWVARNASTGADVAISSVTYNATLNAFDLGIASTDAVIITGASIDILESNGVVGYEVGEVTTTVLSA